jgi:hypothetical protein
MPLYTYIAHYKARTGVEQVRRSNYRGFASSAVDSMVKRSSLGAGLTSLRNELAGKVMRSEWSAVSNTSNVWRTSFDLEGDQFELYAVQSKD